MRVLLTIIIVYLVFKVIGRYVLPMVLSSFMGKMTDKMSDFEEQFRQSTDRRQEGDVTIETNSNRESPAKKLDGDYVDYEELD